jgi:Fe2+ or Zn2+ uptake regulation protein
VQPATLSNAGLFVTLPHFEAIEKEIMSYLITHPEAQDTLEGIAEWWLLHERIALGIAEVKRALEKLVSAGFLIEVSASDGRKRYQLNKERQSEIVKILK